MWLRFMVGRPESSISTQFLDWCCTRLQVQGKTFWLLIWDNASWHDSKQVRTWIREHHQQIKQEGKGVRNLPLFLPKQSSWLNPIEPKWVHAKRNVVEPNGLLTALQLAQHIEYELHFPVLMLRSSIFLHHSSSINLMTSDTLTIPAFTL